MKKNKDFITRKEIADLLGDPSKIRELSKSARSQIIKLSALVYKGSPEAALELTRTVAFGTLTLTGYCKEKPELFRPIAQSEFGWPVIYYLHPESIKENAEFLRKLRLGRNTQINLSSGKTFSWQVPANVVAFNLHQLAQSLRQAPIASWKTVEDISALVECQVGCRSDGLHVCDAKYRRQLEELETWGQQSAGKHLPALSKETAAQWATATRELFRICYGEQFDEHPNLQELRAAVLPRSTDAFGKTGGRGIVRKLMRQAVKQAWHSISAVD